jgi:hypothetical protein
MTKKKNKKKKKGGGSLDGGVGARRKQKKKQKKKNTKLGVRGGRKIIKINVEEICGMAVWGGAASWVGWRERWVGA